MKILITGGTGLIGRALLERLSTQYECVVLTRSIEKARSQLPKGVQAIESLDDLGSPTTALNGYQAVVNLQGEPIADRRWTGSHKRTIEQSRWQVTTELTKLIEAAESPPEVFISGSAVGYYGAQDGQLVTENHNELHDEFAHRLCAKWEVLARQAESEQTRVCLLRTGLVLAPNGGLLKKLKPSYLLGLGGPISDGEQGFSWIHLDDVVGIIEHILSDESCRGAFNATAPHPVAQRAFSAELAKQLHRPHVMKMPAWLLKLIFGEMAHLLLTGQFVVPQRIQAHGYRFRYDNLHAALNACLSPPSSH